MSWQITVTIDKDKVDVGNVSAIWTDPNTDLGVFSFSQRIQADVDGADAFIAEAIIARDAWQVWQGNNNTKSTWALGRLNMADPKVV
ncbi:MAG: hypothetical protein KAJ93_08765 [Methanosarcinales archaeon]|nr:hypothetical protein [Methanosarcinales archaeon]